LTHYTTRCSSVSSMVLQPEICTIFFFISPHCPPSPLD
jgi:hypothetical protein